LAFRVLDASAFYAGIPFGAQEQNYTTPLVFDEIKHIKKSHDAVGILIETKRLIVSEPDFNFTQTVVKSSKETGDFNNLSKEDISAIALCLQLEAEMITDDFAVSNVSKNLGIKVNPIMTSGIKFVAKWVYFCAACDKDFSKITICPNCGNKLKRKLFQRNSSTLS